MSLAALALGFGAGVGASGAAYMLLGKKPAQQQQQQQPATPTPAPVSPAPAPAARSKRTVDLVPTTDATAVTFAAGLDHPALKHGLPVADYLRFYTNFVSSFDGRTRNPQWVIEHITKETVNGPANRKNSEFFEDTAIEPRFRSKLFDYRRSGYDRGHLAPAANNKNSQQAMDDTFTLSNMSPQVGDGFNRDYWARFEQFVRNLANAADAVYCVTGPLYIPQPEPQGKGWRMNYPLIGRAPQLVAVPTHFYKVILAEKAGQPPAVGAFIMPNAPIDANLPLKAFVISLDMLESAAGVKFFPQALTNDVRQELDAAAARIATDARLQLAGSVPQGLLPPAVSLPAAQPTIVPPKQGASRHLCDNVACALPAPWQPGNKKIAD